MAVRIAYVLGIAAVLAAVPADAEAARPVFVVVTGPGMIRLRLAEGITAPCDSSDNRLIFDGLVEAGRYRWTTDAYLICYQHTSRAFPQSGWSESRLVATSTRRGPLEIPVGTE